MTHKEVAEASAQKLPDSEYILADISDELYREVVSFKTKDVYRIESPVSLIIRRGGFTHRVVDSEGIVHCYPAPHTGLTVLRWKAKGDQPVQF